MIAAHTTDEKTFFASSSDSGATWSTTRPTLIFQGVSVSLSLAQKGCEQAVHRLRISDLNPFNVSYMEG